MSSTVLVLGATGYIGGAVAKALRRHGFRVLGGVRDTKKSNDLWKHEIEPVVADVSKPDTYKELLKRVAVVVDASSPDYSTGDKLAVPYFNLVKAIKAASSPANPKQYIYTSGVLVHGHNDHIVDETAPLNPGYMAWRSAFEEEVVGSTGAGFQGTVIRPGYVFGNSGGSYGLVPFFQLAAKGATEYPVDGRPDKKWSWIHVDDLAESYALAVVHRSAAAGQIFDVGLPQAETYESLIRHVAKLGGVATPTFKSVKPEGFGAIQDITVLVNAAKAKAVLGWEPHHVDISQELDISYNAWKAFSHGHGH